jgi:hypothetical protein
MVVAMMTRTDEALTFLRALRPQGPWVLTSIFSDAETTTTKTFDANDEAAVRQFIESHNDTKNIYYSVNPLRTKKASKAKKVDIAAIEYLFADLDPGDGETPEQAKARYLAQLETLKPEPTAITDSGNGIQVLCRLPNVPAHAASASTTYSP